MQVTLCDGSQFDVSAEQAASLHTCLLRRFHRPNQDALAAKLEDVVAGNDVTIDESENWTLLHAHMDAGMKEGPLFARLAFLTTKWRAAD